MNDHPAVIFAAAMIFIYGLFSKAADRSPVTAPMVFVTVGILVGIEGYERILAVIVLTVLLSVFLHGISAVPLSHRYGNSPNKAG